MNIETNVSTTDGSYKKFMQEVGCEAHGMTYKNVLIVELIVEGILRAYKIFFLPGVGVIYYPI